MRIDRIEKSKHKQERVLVFREGGDLLRITGAELLRFGLYKGMDLPPELVVELQAAAQKSELKQTAARMASGQMLSKKEVQRRLTKKGATEQEAEETADWLESLGAVDDAGYAGVIVRHYGAMGYGAGRVRQELHRRGVPKELWDCLLYTSGDSMKKVLVLEDESSIRSFIVINLRRAGYEVVEAESGEEALEKLKLHSDVRVALLDIMLPGIDGFEVCRRIRATNASIGIIMLTARSQEMDKVTGLMTGADDYVTKPFSPAELTARVDALMRRSGGAAVEAGEINQPPFLLNTRNRTLEKNGQRIKLTQVEYAIMKMFMENPGKALSREEILDMVWGHDYFGELKIVDVNIRRLRLKIEDNATNPTYITTIWGFGYKWGL